LRRVLSFCHLLLAIEAADANARIIAAHISGLSEMMRNADRSVQGQKMQDLRQCNIHQRPSSKAAQKGTTFRFRPKQEELGSHQPVTVPVGAIRTSDETDRALDLLLA
jgi:hypothetical protein